MFNEAEGEEAEKKLEEVLDKDLTPLPSEEMNPDGKRMLDLVFKT